MNAPARIDPAKSSHLFTYEEVVKMMDVGILSDRPGVELIEGQLLMRSSEKPYRFTLDEVREMIEAGILGADERVELIDGELIDMAPQNAPHMEAKRALAGLLYRKLGDEVAVHVEGTLALSVGVAPQPDIFIHGAQHRVDRLRGPDVLLVIEIADSSLTGDLGPKAALYAKHGVREYWVVDAYARRIFVHRAPSAAGYQFLAEYSGTTEITPESLSGLVVRPGDLPRAD